MQKKEEKSFDKSRHCKINDDESFAKNKHINELPKYPLKGKQYYEAMALVLEDQFALMKM